MSMPKDLVFVRHGQSEANLVQKHFKDDPEAVAPEGFFDRHDSQMRLSGKGRWQAEAAGEWLSNEFPEGFDKYYVSPLVRTLETAGRLAINGAWRPDDRWRERDWGEYGLLNEAEQVDKYELSHRLKSQHKWYWCPPGGESLATGVRLRFEDILDTLHREASSEKVIAVTHGEMIEVARFVLERLIPEEWLSQSRDKNYRVENCQILHYTRMDPLDNTKEPDRRLAWLRSICPWDPSKSWNNGEWQSLPRLEPLSDTKLLAVVEGFPQLLDDAT